MLGWEFPPYHSGGLGTACYGLTKGLSSEGVNVTFVLPSLHKNIESDFVKLIGANIKFKTIDSPLSGYMTTASYRQTVAKNAPTKMSMYGQDLMDEVYRFSRRVKTIAKRESFDVIHAHDWLTYQAGINAKSVSGKPLVVHVHATEFDRCASENINRQVYNIEKRGMRAADRVITVSNFTKGQVLEHYDVDPSKIDVVHNAVEIKSYADNPNPAFTKTDKIVLFLGRITIQKGPEHFLWTAKRVLEKMPDTKFVVAGSGDMERYMIDMASQLGIAKNVLFTGFLRGPDIDAAYRMADVYVMPSLSEPFGITPLEAMMHGTPTIISKQSGVSEVVNHALKVDFWDIDEMANKILAILQYPGLSDTMKENGYHEVRKFDWKIPARKCAEVYNKVMGRRR